jgi:hypothetical protein
MSSHPALHRPKRTTSTRANARALAILAQPPPRMRAAPIKEAAPEREGIKGAPNPLWVIAIAMAVFFGFTAVLMMFDSGL